MDKHKIRLFDLMKKMTTGEVAGPPVSKLIGFTLTDIQETGETTMTMETGPQHFNPIGMVHGGILCDLACAAMEMSCASTLEADQSFATIEIKTNFLRPAWFAKLTAKAHLVSAGKNIVLAECDIFDEKNKLMAKSSLTCLKYKTEERLKKV